MKQCPYSNTQVVRMAQKFGTPTYIYDESQLLAHANEVLHFPNAFGLTARFAMKALPNARILQLFDRAGLHFDCSSGYEVERVIRAGIKAEKCSLSSQELPDNLSMLIDAGIRFNATSLHQLETFGKLFPGKSVGLRLNPGLGSGGTGKTNVGGPDSSFGLWYELIDEAKEIVKAYGLKVERIHTHIGSGSDPAIWQKVSGMSLNMVREFPDVHTLNLGGGFKVGRLENETTTDLREVGKPVQKAFEDFAEETRRKLQLEIEPGTWLVANAGSLLSRIQDIVNTGEKGNIFYRLDCGMTEILRPSLYGAQHPMYLIPLHDDTDRPLEAPVIVGHCCESGDLLTPQPGDPEAIATRSMPKARIGDLMLIGGAGAYCSSMSAKNYNSFPECAEVLFGEDGKATLIRKRQTLEQIIANEV